MLEIEERDIGGWPAEGYYTTFPDTAPALMAIQPGLSAETKRARAYEAHGYHFKPPRGGRRFCLALSCLSWVDDKSITATRAVIDDLAPELVSEVKESYLASEYGDAYWIAFDVREHVHVVLAILRNLEERGELPPRSDWGA